MMMNYHSRDSRKKKRKILLIILVGLVLFFYSNIIAFAGGIFRFITEPIWGAENNITQNFFNPFNFFVSKENLIVSLQQAQKDKEDAELMLADRNLLLKENIELKDALGRVDKKDVVLASVLSKPNNSFYDSLLIDAGSEQGIKKDDKVFVSGDILIGFVSEVNKNSSKVVLYSSPKEESDVMVAFNIEAKAVGRGGGNFEIILPRDTDVEVGDPVASFGFNALLLGSVESVDSNPIDSFKTILVKSPVNIFELKWIQVEKSE